MPACAAEGHDADRCGFGHGLEMMRMMGIRKESLVEGVQNWVLLYVTQLSFSAGICKLNNRVCSVLLL